MGSPRASRAREKDMKVWLIADTHWNHDNIATYCVRPENFTEIIMRNWKRIVQPNDSVIHLGDVAIGNRRAVRDILAELPGRKTLIRGNHDRQHSNTWWMANGFDFACDAMIFRNVWLTHEPSASRAPGCDLNVHGHMHTISRAKAEAIMKPWQKLFALEYLDYMPWDFDKFVRNPDKVPHTANGAKHPLF